MTNHASSVKIYRNMLVRNLESVSVRLRGLADFVDQEKERIQYVPGLGAASFIGIVSGVQGRILWGIANMRLDQFANTAALADMEQAVIRAKWEE